MKRILTVSALAAVSWSCWNFNKLYDDACKGSACGGGVASGGGMATGGGNGVGGGEGTMSGGGSATGGGNGGGGSNTFDAGACGSWGSKCTGEGQCCATDTIRPGVALACSVYGYCEETGEVCRETGFSCTDAASCCYLQCEGGKCGECIDEKNPKACTSAQECCIGLSCVEGRCKMGSQPNGARCQSSPACASGYCDLNGALRKNGVCAVPKPAGCRTFDTDADGGVCCEGTAPTAADYHKGYCRMPDLTRCLSSTECIGDWCSGGYCGTGSRKLGQRCDNAANCAGRDTVCSYNNLSCANRYCISKKLGNGFEGCCNIDPNGTFCTFSDGQTCLLPGNPSASAAECCSGRRDPVRNTCENTNVR